MNPAFLLVFVAAIGFAVAIPWAIRADRADAHLIHTRNCADCASDDEWSGL